MLGLPQDAQLYTKGMAETYPNVFNQTGTSDAVWSNFFPEEDSAFPELSNGGRRSPRSGLFDYLVAENAAPGDESEEEDMSSDSEDIIGNLCLHDMDYCIAIRSVVEEHFDLGGASSSAHLNARLGDIEDQYLESEAEEEAYDDLQSALRRLREGIRKFVAVAPPNPAQFPNISSLCATRCTNHWQVLEYC